MIATATQFLTSAQWRAVRISGPTPLWAILVAIAACVLVAVCVVAVSVVGFRHTRGSDDNDQGDSGPGGRGPESPPPPDQGPDGDPTWWPEFELQFAAYAQAVASRAPALSTARGAASPLTTLQRSPAMQAGLPDLPTNHP